MVSMSSIFRVPTSDCVFTTLTEPGERESEVDPLGHIGTEQQDFGQ